MTVMTVLEMVRSMPAAKISQKAMTPLERAHQVYAKQAAWRDPEFLRMKLRGIMLCPAVLKMAQFVPHQPWRAPLRGCWQHPPRSAATRGHPCGAQRLKSWRTHATCSRTSLAKAPGASRAAPGRDANSAQRCSRGGVAAPLKASRWRRRRSTRGRRASRAGCRSEVVSGEQHCLRCWLWRPWDSP